MKEFHESLGIQTPSPTVLRDHTPVVHEMYKRELVAGLGSKKFTLLFTISSQMRMSILELIQKVPSRVIKVPNKAFKKRLIPGVFVQEVDEYLTTKICSICHHQLETEADIKKLLKAKIIAISSACAHRTFRSLGFGHHGSREVGCV